MSRRKKTRGVKERRPGEVTKPPVQPTTSSRHAPDRKLSEIIKEMALRLLKEPDAIPSEPATVAALMLANAAWNSAIGDSSMRDRHRALIDQIDWEDVTPWAELRSGDTEHLIAELVAYKREHYPNDLRRILATEMSPEGNLRVHWSEPEKVGNASFGDARTKARASKAKRGRPIADKRTRTRSSSRGSGRTSCGARRLRCGPWPASRAGSCESRRATRARPGRSADRGS